MKSGIKEIEPGMYMITLPMPLRLQHVNIFGIMEEDGYTLIDTGPNMEGVMPALELSLSRIGRRVEDCRRILLSHFHTDHCGLAGLIADRSGASIYLSDIEYMTIRKLVVDKERAIRLRRFGSEHGLDDGTIETVIQDSAALWKATSPFTATGSLSHGDRLIVGNKTIRVVATPGHSRGHISFYLPQTQMLIAGDHILPYITPNLSPDPTAPDYHPLESFLSSLSLIENLPVATVYPAHGRPFTNLKGRIASLREHHLERSGFALQALSHQYKTACEISRVIFGDDLPPFDRVLALNETFVHLIELEKQALIRREQHNGLCLFARI